MRNVAKRIIIRIELNITGTLPSYASAYGRMKPNILPPDTRVLPPNILPPDTRVLPPDTRVYVARARHSRETSLMSVRMHAFIFVFSVFVHC
jgi:hypothetical protein